MERAVGAARTGVERCLPQLPRPTLSRCLCHSRAALPGNRRDGNLTLLLSFCGEKRKKKANPGISPAVTKGLKGTGKHRAGRAGGTAGGSGAEADLCVMLCADGELWQEHLPSSGVVHAGGGGGRAQLLPQPC
ncbi:uncharacterized protein GJ701_013676 isoform 2-T2 [Geothlypis trichas]